MARLVLLLILTSVYSASAQVQVSKEPRHKTALLNQYIRLLDVHISPHDTTLYHRHSTASAVVLLSKTRTGSQLLGGAPSSGQSLPGNTFFAAYGEKPIVHRVWNEDSSTFHVMDIELLNTPSPGSCAIISDPAVHLAWNEKPARMYIIHEQPGNTIVIPAERCPHLLVVISDSTEASINNRTKKLRNGNFTWYPPGSRIAIRNETGSEAVYALLELK